MLGGSSCNKSSIPLEKIAGRIILHVSLFYDKPWVARQLRIKRSEKTRVKLSELIKP